MADDEERLTIRFDGGLTALVRLNEATDEERVQVVSCRWQGGTTPNGGATSPRAFTIVLQGAEPAIEAVVARFRQLSTAQVEKLPPGSW